MAASPRRRSLTATDPAAGMTLDDVAGFVSEMMGHYELPGSTPVRCMGMIEIDFESGPRVARLTADPSADTTN
jgi:hypothetical protein